MSQAPKPAEDLQFDVVIAGGGFTGVYCAKALGRRFGDEGPEKIAIIAEENFMVFQPMLPEIAGSALNPRHVVNPIRRLCQDVCTLRGKITSIDYAGRRLVLEAGDFTKSTIVHFQHLVLALGGVVDLSRVPGMPEHAYLMKNVGDALRLRGAIIDRFEEANLECDPEEQKRLLTFAIVGGGYSGVETAGQVFDFARQMARSYNRIPAGSLRVLLIHSGPHLLPEISESLGRYTEQTMKERGVEVILNARVTAMTASRLMLEDKRVIESHTVVSTVGNAQHPLIKELCKQGVLNCEKGRILVDETMRVIGQENLWSAGDSAAVPMPQTAGSRHDASPMPKTKAAVSPYEPRPFCPPTAQFALRQGTLLGKNIAGLLQGKDAPRPFTFTGLGELASIGHRAAVAEIFGMQFHGFIAWWMWRSIYLMKLPGLERKLRVMVDWTLDLFFPRDITLFQSRPTEVFKEMHLEKDDIVFHANDPALSLYIVRSGQIELRDDQGAVLRNVVGGNQIGRQTLQTSKVWPFTAVATEPTTLILVSAKVFETISRAGISVDEVFGKPETKTETPAVLQAAAAG